MKGLIKNIVFDLGGVLLDIDYQKSVDAFQKLGISNFEKMFSQTHANDMFENLERGKLRDAEFYAAIKSMLTNDVSQEEIDAASNALILDFRESSLHFLEELARQYKLYLLSNTNSIHVKYFKSLFSRQTGRASLDDHFTKAWYSNEIGLRKPDPEIFSYILEEEGLIARDTLFIDDTAANIATARDMGFKTHLLLPGERIEMLDYDLV
jgi:glucose-1-phosphatase